jgi:hypothetical protein
MALYKNQTRRDAVVTVKINSVIDPQKALSVGATSAMAAITAEVGFHDVVVGPGQVLEVSDGVDATFVASRGD